jgi:hypothetical protein
MQANSLIDTGAILALLDRTDRWHRLCVETFPLLRLPLITSQAVLTGWFHLVGDDRREMAARESAAVGERFPLPKPLHPLFQLFRQRRHHRDLLAR